MRVVGAASAGHRARLERPAVAGRGPRVARSIFCALVLVVVSTAVLFGARAAPAGASIAPHATCPSPVQGVDVSHYDGSITWPSVKTAGISFGYAGVGDGATYSDPTFQANYAGMRAAGVTPGAYLFFRAAQDPTTQANNLITALTTAGFTSGDLVPAVDV